jgi:hypothetical protein
MIHLVGTTPKGGYGALWMKEVRSGCDLGDPANISLIVRKCPVWLIRELD